MFRVLVAGAFAVFGLVTVAHAGSDFPPCSLSQLAPMFEFAADYDALEDQMAVAETLEDFLAFRETQLNLRDRTWDTLPRCAEAIVYGHLLTRRFELYSALSANLFWWTALDKPHPDTIFNPYREPFLDENYSERFHQLRSEIEAKLADDSSQDIANGSLPKCSGQELEILYRVKNEYLLLLEAFWGIAAQRDIPEYGAAHVQWSDELRARLPACELAFEAGIRMQQDTFNRAISFTLVNAGVATERIPYHAQNMQAFDKIQALMTPVKEDYLSHASTWMYDDTLPSCTTKERDSLYAILQGYLNLLNNARGAGNTANLIEFGRALIAWRTESWTQLPSCSEAMEVGALVRQSAGDTVELASEDLAWLPPGAIESLETALSGAAGLGQVLVDIDADRFGGEYPWHRHLNDEDNRPTCTREAIGDIVKAVRGFLDVLEIGKLRNNWTGGLLAYVDARISWRMVGKASVPDCRIRYSLSSLLSRDALGLLSGGLPIIGQLLTPRDGQQTTLAGPVEESDFGNIRRAYSNNLRRCNADELRRFVSDTEAYVSIIRDSPQVENIDDLFAQIERNLDWRDEQWVDLLICAETFEIGVLINQIASDMIAVRALEIAGISPILNPYYRNRQRDIAELTVRVQEIAGLIAERDDAAPPAESSALTFCTDDELATMRTLLGDFRKGPRLVFKGLTPQAVSSYSQFQDEWRPSIWSEIPSCFEAVEVGLLMTRQSGDVATISALDKVDASLEDDPFMHSRYCDYKALGTWLILLSAAEASTRVDVFSCVGLDVPQLPQ